MRALWRGHAALSASHDHVHEASSREALRPDFTTGGREMSPGICACVRCV
ncbi:hypothetical protein DVU_2465 [Nitratidesulfovibrio vulgaris str. Hildenborough]|uniref:Uncharacterized protein n=1 Tax=Nitratidesulfovibrio vulgaris (strain ATCC 29579 / DSM 644 / CCUG 34227 / NCIMB 8303 / VKM B-1760 / Hildenborough) TaxID=882 RepID=Q728Y7_NITV2|nr:hypothetical protein DVU_2465 [Nitratidesulfovibrio vulgaris str. Hildenborough]